MTIREELYNRITDTDFGDEEDVFRLVQSLASDILRYHDICADYEKTLTEVMSTKAYKEWVAESAQKVFVQEIGKRTRDKNPEGIWLDIVCEIQREKLDNGGCHVGDAVDWCIFGRELKNAIYKLFGEDSQQ